MTKNIQILEGDQMSINKRKKNYNSGIKRRDLSNKTQYRESYNRKSKKLESLYKYIFLWN